MKSLLPFLDSSPHKKQPKEDVEPPKPPPKTCDEWLASSRAAGHMVSADGTLSIQASKGNGAIKWPIHPPHMDWLVSATSLPGEEGRIGKKKHSRPGDTILGSLDEIKEDLRKHAPWDPRPLDNVEQNLNKLEDSVKMSSGNFVDDQQRPSKESLVGGLANVSELTIMTELSRELLSMHRPGSDVEEDKMIGSSTDDDNYALVLREMKRITGTKNTNELISQQVRLNTDFIIVPLPAKLDALSILDLVNSTAAIPSFLVESWKRVFFCSECVRFLQNAFWWMWLDYFKPKKWIQTLLFDQLADDFVIILNKMEGRYKDEVFMHFPVFLSQALYSTFCQAFPNSSKELNSSEFLNYLCNIVSEWILGVQSQPNQWEQWPRHAINPFFLSSRMETETVNQDSRLSIPEKDMINMSQQLSRLLASKLSFTSEGDSTGRKLYSARRENTAVDSPCSSIFSLSKLEKGPVFECVRFNIHGRSPLLQHYLYHHNLTDFKSQPGITISRTQIKELPSHKFTYQQVAMDHKRRAQRLYEEYKSRMAQTEQEIALERSKFKKSKKRLSHQQSLQYHQEGTRKSNSTMQPMREGIN